jgi:hypothetical protein
VTPKERVEKYGGLYLEDPDEDSPGDCLTCDAVGGFGEPMLALFCCQDGDESGVNLTWYSARRLRDFLQVFLDKYPDGKYPEVKDDNERAAD